MSILDWLFIGLLSAAILCGLFVLILFIQSFLTGRKRAGLQKKRIKNKKKRKKLQRRVQKMKKQQWRQFRSALLLLVLGGALGGGAFYSRYYQAHRLGEQDSNAIVQGYHLVATIEEELGSEESLANPEKAATRLRDLTGRLSSYGTRVPSQRLSEEGQRLLSRQYSYMSELGMNLYTQADDLMVNEETRAAVEADLEKIQTHQQKVLTYFSINEDSLKKTN
ncbi:hypothetical protein [uncultured Enterococcus sp.]|uniref:hypothetical protein n=1 Tax=uncultured Enterococcus sp. TaxID=167972 RepID=UPI002AA6D255|nr:hypothetical protein [uncultured Enterococcus sp.]